MDHGGGGGGGGSEEEERKQRTVLRRCQESLGRAGMQIGESGGVL